MIKLMINEICQVHHKEVQFCTEGIWSCYWLHSRPSACMNILRQADCQLLFWVMNLCALSMESEFSFLPPIMLVIKVKAECAFLRFGLVDLRRYLCIWFCRHCSKWLFNAMMLWATYELLCKCVLSAFLQITVQWNDIVSNLSAVV